MSVAELVWEEAPELVGMQEWSKIHERLRRDRGASFLDQFIYCTPESWGSGGYKPPMIATSAPSPDDELKGEFDHFGHAAELKKWNDNE